MKQISGLRFDALAGYARQPATKHMFQEVAWFSHFDERVLGVLVKHWEDGDFAGAVFGRDRKGRYRAVELTVPFQENATLARIDLRRAMERVSGQPDESYFQGDEKGKPLDFFAPQAPDKEQNPSFRMLLNDEGHAAAKGIIKPLMHWFEDPDGNFVEQFQSSGFDARIWELYLYAAFVEMGYAFDRTKPMPDFTCEGINGIFCVEAVTVNPTVIDGAIQPPPQINTPDDILQYQREYMPIKFGSPLTSKLKKRYWEKPHVAGKPLIFAIQDFSAPGSLLDSRAGLPIYLYGIDYDWTHDNDGQLVITPREVKTHRWGSKEIPSGFFNLPDSEHISGVLFSNSGTISKFNRMGVLAGFGLENVTLLRHGSAVNHDPNATEPLPFIHRVDPTVYTESWSEGLELYHNPNSLHPLDPALLPNIAHYHLLEDGLLQGITPKWHPLVSHTQVLVGVKEL
ncbi:hypothetical protein [Hymenobacter jeollabukensis]|uniref:Glycosaminoglycan attachment protein n=1 Tax=Hymenobacter jeollabukensis TaxID=2025313 RepID=A0A5R8WH94_9BACT|nr:hypothetical protein [Hymenobacter jeollabukensis]TLM87836.1 hypothetical protein FDY95_25410 [Hymenobacter jeollabukensis]